MHKNVLRPEVNIGCLLSHYSSCVWDRSSLIEPVLMRLHWPVIFFEDLLVSASSMLGLQMHAAVPTFFTSALVIQIHVCTPGTSKDWANFLVEGASSSAFATEMVPCPVEQGWTHVREACMRGCQMTVKGLWNLSSQIVGAWQSVVPATEGAFQGSQWACPEWQEAPVGYFQWLLKVESLHWCHPQRPPGLHPRLPAGTASLIPVPGSAFCCSAALSRRFLKRRPGA